MSEWMAGMGNHLWQTTAFAVVVWAMTLLLRKNQARVRYGLWVAASVKFLLPFSLLIALGGMLPRPQRMVAAPAVYSTMDEVALPFSEPMPEADPTHAAMKPRHEWGTRVVEAVPAALGVVWGCGVGVVLAVWGTRWRRVWKTLRRAEMVEQGREFDLLQQVQLAMGGRARVSLRLSGELMEPGIFGILRPVLIWPQRLSDRLDDEHIEAILLHELEHVGRRDNLMAALHMVVEAAFWFHPLVWWIERRMVEERERACDEAVVAMGSRPGVYAESLLKAVRFCVESPLTCVAGITGADLSKRVRGIMTMRLEPLNAGKRMVLATLVVAAIAVPVVFGVMRMIPVYAQITEAVGPLPEFEVATIKPSDPGARGAGFRIDGRHFNTINTSATDLLEYAYDIHGRQLVGAPAWLDQSKYNIAAEAPADSSDPKWKLMVRRLLAERFGLAFHHDTKELPVYELQIAKGGPKIAATSDSTGDHSLYVSRASKGASAMTLHAKLATMAGLAELLQTGVVDRLVVDRTGLPGAFNFELTFDRDQVKGGGASGPPADDAEVQAGIFTAIQEQLGLKLVAAKGPAEVLVVDHIEKPTLDDVTPAQRPSAQTVPDTVYPSGATAQASLKPVALVQGQPTPNAALPLDSKPLAFDVVSIKPAKPGSSGQDSDFAEGRFVATNISLKNLMQYDTYGMPAVRILGWPAWVDSARFDIAARLDARSYERLKGLNTEQAQLATRALFEQFLAEQFKLAVHRDTQTLPVYALEVAKGGPKFHAMVAGGEQDSTSSHNRKLTAKGVTMQRMADTLTRLFGQQLGRVVIDKTGLVGQYDLTLDWTPPQDAAADAQNDLGAAIFTAVEEQLGLKLVSAKGPVEVLVIDHAEKPAAN